MIRRLRGVLTSRRGPLVLTALAVLISLPALPLGFQTDDHLIAMRILHSEERWFVFELTAEQVARARESGAFAWWTSPGVHGAFLRPLSAVIQAALLTVAPKATWLMSLVNVLVYGACVWVAAHAYRRIVPQLASAAVAGLAFAIDEAHAPSVGWISGRNTIMALLGSLTALLFYARSIERGRTSDAFVSVLAVVFALASGEAGTWALCYLIAYAAVLDIRPWLARIRSLAPHLAVGLAWAAIYVGGDYGIHRSSWYLELSSPGAVLAHGLSSLPLTITSLFGISAITTANFGLLWRSQVLLMPVAAVLSWLVWPALWTCRASRFFGLATALAVLPTFPTMPQDRLLAGASFAAFGWIATALSESTTKSLRHRATRIVLCGCHIAVPALLFVPMLTVHQRSEIQTDALRAMTVGGRTAVLVNAPYELIATHTQAKHALYGLPGTGPRALHTLYAGSSELIVARTGERELDVIVARGWGYLPIERIFCALEDMPRAGDERRVRGMTARTLETNPSGLPTRVRFTFDAALESSDLQWVVWTHVGPQPWRPPALGERARVAPIDLSKRRSTQRSATL
jgi:hypothetical protein